MTTPIGITLSLDGAQQTEAGLRRVAGSMDSVGVSAKQTAAALRGVPAQFTDIITSLQGGQAPLTVLLQQGGQLKDMFGGAGAAAKALGGYVAGLVTPFSVAAGSIAALGYAMYKGAEQQRAFQQALIVSGNAAGATAGQIEGIYAAVSKSTRQYGASEDVINGLVRSRQVGFDQLQATAAAVVQFSRAAGVDARALVADFSAIGKDPVKAVLALQEKYGVLTAATYQQAAALVEQGKQQEAIMLVQSRAAEGMDKIGKAAKENKGYLEQFWDAVKGGASGAWQGAMDLGKDETPEAKLARLRQTLADKQTRGPLNDTAGVAASYAKGLAALQSEIDKTQLLVSANQDMAKTQGDAAQINERATAGITKLNSAYDSHLNKSEQLVKQLRELKQARDDALQAPDVDVAAVNQRYDRTVEDVKRQLAPSYNMSSLMHSLYLQESGNRQFNDRGETITNARSGATGIAQIMPQYGADYARMAGVEWSLESLKTDPEYGKRLAEAGIKTYLKMFGNDVEKALAAYNWGPANVKAAVGQVGDAWRTKLPAETSKYITGILGRMPKDQAGDYSDALGAAPSSAFEASLTEARKKLAQATAEADAAQRGLTKSQTEFEVLQASPVWSTYNEGQKETLTLLAKRSEVQDRIKASAEDGNKIKALADAQEAMNASFGQSRIAAEQWKVAQLGANAAVAEALGQSPQLVAQLKRTAEEQMRYVAALQAADIKQTMQGLDEWKRSATEQAKLYEDEAQLSGLTALERNKIVAARQVELKLAKAISDINLEEWTGTDGEQAKANAIDKARSAAQIESSAAVAKVVRDDWAKTADQINQSLTDALMRGFESGKGFAQNMRDTLVNMFKTLVLRPVISAVLAPVGGMIAGAANAATGGGGGSGVMGMASNASSAYSLFSGGSAISSGFGMAMSGGMGAALEGGAAMLGSATGVSSALAGLGQIAGALGPIALGIGAIALLAKSFDNSGTPHMGAGAIYSEAGGLQDGAGIYNKGKLGMGIAEEWTKGTQDGVTVIAKGLTQTFDGIAKTFGRTAGYEIATAFADDSSKDGAWGSLRISKAGKDLLNWQNSPGAKDGIPKGFSDGSEGYKEYLAAIAKDTRQVLLDMDLPSWATAIITSIGDVASMDQLAAAVQQIGKIQTAFAQLGKTIDGFAGMSDKAFEALMKASGGIDTLAQNAGTYYDSFYSEAEKTASVTRGVSEALAAVGLQMPATREEFRALVESQLALGEGGTQAVAALLGVSGAFASVVPAAASAQASIQAQADAMEGLQIKLLRAQGNEVAAVALERQKELAALQAFGPAAVAMQQQIYGVIDAMAAMNANASAYFSGVDKQQAMQSYTSAGESALDKFFGAVAQSAGDAQISTARASSDAARTAAASWRSAAQSIQSAIDKMRTDSILELAPADRYAAAKGAMDTLAGQAMGGNVDAVGKLADATNTFLSVSQETSVDRAEYLRDRAMAEAKLASVLTTATAQASVQDVIASSASAAVDQLTAMNANLTGFSAQVYELLSKSYQGADRNTAGAAAAGLASLQANFDAYFRDTKTGQVDQQLGDKGYLTRLAGDVGAYTDTTGALSYFRAGESVLDLAKRIPDFRELWEKQFGLKLPSFAVGTNFLPSDMLIQAHAGERIIPAADNRALMQRLQGGGSGPALIAELRALREEVAQLKSLQSEGNDHARKTAVLLDDVTEGGNLMRTTAL